MQKYTPPDGRVFQAFTFVLKPTTEQQQALHRFFGARRFAHNWAVTQIKTHMMVWQWFRVSLLAPSFYGLRNTWDQQKHTVAVNAQTGEAWWCDVSKHVFRDGIRAAADSYWRWQKSRAGTLAGRRVGFPATINAANIVIRSRSPVSVRSSN